MNPGIGRKATLIAAGMGVAVLLGWLVTSQGPLAPVKVTVAKVERGTLGASTFGIGTIEARRSHGIGPTVARAALAGGDAGIAGPDRGGRVAHRASARNASAAIPR